MADIGVALAGPGACGFLLFYVLREHFKNSRIVAECVNRNTQALEKLSVKIDGCQK